MDFDNMAPGRMVTRLPPAGTSTGVRGGTG
jgi:hypothetical protein